MHLHATHLKLHTPKLTQKKTASTIDSFVITNSYAHNSESKSDATRGGRRASQGEVDTCSIQYVLWFVFDTVFFLLAHTITKWLELQIFEFVSWWYNANHRMLRIFESSTRRGCWARCWGLMRGRLSNGSIFERDDGGEGCADGKSGSENVRPHWFSSDKSVFSFSPRFCCSPREERE